MEIRGIISHRMAIKGKIARSVAIFCIAKWYLTNATPIHLTRFRLLPRTRKTPQEYVNPKWDDIDTILLYRESRLHRVNSITEYKQNGVFFLSSSFISNCGRLIDWIYIWRVTKDTAHPKSITLSTRVKNISYISVCVSKGDSHYHPPVIIRFHLVSTKIILTEQTRFFFCVNINAFRPVIRLFRRAYRLFFRDSPSNFQLGGAKCPPFIL